MSIMLPNLDDRRWSDLVEQGRALIPLFAPEWTDHNASDPGITLMELLASVTEMDIYRLNRLTGAQKLRLLALMGVRPAPVRPATVASELRISAGAGPVALPAGSQFAGMLVDGTAVLLRSMAPIDVAAAGLRAFQRKDATGFQNCTAAWMRRESIALFGEDPTPGAEFYLGFDQALPVGSWTRLHVGIEGEQAGAAERARIAAHQDGAGPPVHHGARVMWEYLADAGASGVWRALDAIDDTRAFSLAGSVQLRPAQAMKPASLGRVAQPFYWVRCRFGQGAFDAAPRASRLFANGVELVQSVPATTSWPIRAGTVASGSLTPGQSAVLRLTVEQGQIVALAADGTPGAPALVVLAYEAATATTAGLLVIEGALAGIGAGEPAQRFILDERPLVESSVLLFSVEGERFRTWTQVDDFAASTRNDAHFRLDPTRGEVIVGDGEKGRVLPSGCQLFACYEATQPAPALSQLAGLADTPHNRAFGGAGAIGRIAAEAPVGIEAAAAAETLAHALGRAIELREARLRAVTAEDFEAIARATPGVRVARAIARPNLFPALECERAPGMVTVIVLPTLPLARPMPGAGFVERIAAYIEARRTIGTRVVVAGPRYLEVTVHATLKSFDGVDKRQLSAQVAQALDAFFDPLAGGPDGTGWPLGRDVFRAEVMQVIDQTPGVDHVLSLDLAAEGCAPTCGNLCLRPTWLVAAGPHHIEVA